MQILAVILGQLVAPVLMWLLDRYMKGKREDIKTNGELQAAKLEIKALRWRQHVTHSSNASLKLRTYYDPSSKGLRPPDSRSEAR